MLVWKTQKEVKGKNSKQVWECNSLGLTKRYWRKKKNLNNTNKTGHSKIMREIIPASQSKMHEEKPITRCKGRKSFGVKDRNWTNITERPNGWIKWKENCMDSKKTLK